MLRTNKLINESLIFIARAQAGPSCSQRRRKSNGKCLAVDARAIFIDLDPKIARRGHKILNLIPGARVFPPPNQTAR
jgi:hypothetical protein